MQFILHVNQLMFRYIQFELIVFFQNFIIT